MHNAWLGISVSVLVFVVDFSYQNHQTSDVFSSHIGNISIISVISGCIGGDSSIGQYFKPWNNHQKVG